jgi:hypothetical protein
MRGSLSKELCLAWNPRSHRRATLAATRSFVLTVPVVLALSVACGPSGSPTLSEPVDLTRKDAGDKKDARTFDGPSPGSMPDTMSAPSGSADGATGDPADGATALPSPDAAPADAALTATGAACVAGDQCASGQCVDGVCCASACAMPCHACDVAGAAGQCLAVADGTDPGNDCMPEALLTCGRDGFCDGKGACRRYPAGAECVPGSCSGSTESAARTCDGNGTCRPGDSRSCAPNVCMGSSCASRCTGNTQCQTGFFCDAGSCRAKRPAGQACTAAGECSSGNCVDGVCCQAPCGMPCHACNLPGTVGTCTPIPAGADPGNDCPADPVAGCQRDGTCNGRGGCRLYTANVECAPRACASGIETSARLCNGLGVCAPATGKSCGNFACGEALCKTTCAMDVDCKTGLVCRDSACVASGLVLHWKFDEAEGAVARDASGNGHDGMYTGVTGAPAPSTDVAPLKVPNPHSRAFTGASRQAALLAGMPALLKPASQVTVSAWYRTSKLDTGSGSINGSEVVSAGNNYLLRVRETDIEVSKRVGGSSSSWVRCFAVVMNHFDNTWHHIATVIDGQTAKVYFDGVEKCSLANSQAMSYDRGNDFVVGRHGENESNFDFDGNIDDVRIYARALPAPEIAALARGEN